jgi:hypothetical protein
MNTVNMVACPAVICQRTGPVFKWEAYGSDELPDAWEEGDELPDEIANALPTAEWSRCEVHRWRRICNA